jgi:multiple sugar transport system ATP-binding protein
MNLLEAKISVDGGVSVDLAGTTLQVPDEALAAYPKVRDYDGRTAVVGLRAQYLHPASDRPDLPTLDASVELVEALGGESIVYFRVEANVIREGQEEEEDEVETAGEGVVAQRPNLVAQYPAHVQLQIHERVPVAVEVARMHFFDEESGEPLR